MTESAGGIGGSLYGAALSTHLSFVVDDASRSDGNIRSDGGPTGEARRASVGIGEASKNLREDVAGVREVTQWSLSRRCRREMCFPIFSLLSKK